jgi:hypothetical protein
MTPLQWRALCDCYGTAEVARQFGLSARTVQRYARGEIQRMGKTARADLLVPERAKRVAVYADRAAQGISLFSLPVRV